MKYIDADRLKAEIERRRLSNRYIDTDGYESELLDIIDSLQQEQPEVQNGKFVFPKYLYARTKDNKTIDMSYAPQDMAAVEYTRADLLQQEQPQVADASKMEQPEINFNNIDSRVQYASIDAAIKASAETYSFNIESRLTPSLSKEQMKIWRKEIEQAAIAGGEMGIELKNDN